MNEVKIKGWIARDGDGYLSLSRAEPRRQKDFGGYWDAGDQWNIPDNDNSFPNLKWEDEPLEVEITIKAI